MRGTRESIIAEIADGRTDLVFDLVASGCPVDAKDNRGVSLIQHCAYFGDVSAMKHLIAQGESLNSLGANLGLEEAVFHGHWRLCTFLLEHGGDANWASPETGETLLHTALCNVDRVVYDRVLKVLLAHGAKPNCATKPGIVTGGFMRDCRTKGETPLHRAAAFGGEETIRMLLDAGAIVDARDANGDTPLSWASWYLRPRAISRQLCYGEFRIHPANRDMRENLLGDPHL